jgi:IMP and pyridine-specific 5'-nucleotidase
MLDEIALSTQRRLNQYQHLQLCKRRLASQDALPKFKETVTASMSLHASQESEVIVPFCAFNGGSETWVDIGNKLIGIQILQEYLGKQGDETLHVGDQ